MYKSRCLFFYWTVGYRFAVRFRSCWHQLIDVLFSWPSVTSYVSFCWVLFILLSVTLRATQPGHPSMGRRTSVCRSWDVKRHTVRCTGPVSMVLQCINCQQLVTDWGDIARRHPKCLVARERLYFLMLCCRYLWHGCHLLSVCHGCVVAERCKIWPKLLLISNRKLHKPLQMRWKLSTLDDLEGQYCNRNCISCNVSFLATVGLSVLCNCS